MGPCAAGAHQVRKTGRQARVAGVTAALDHAEGLRRSGAGVRDAALGDRPRGEAGPGDARAAGAAAAIAGGKNAGGGGSGIFHGRYHGAAGCCDPQRFAALHRLQFGGARGSSLRRRAVRSVLRSAAGQTIPQEIQAAEDGRRQAPAERSAQGVQGIRRKTKETEHRHCRIPGALCGRIQRSRAAGRILRARRISDRSGFAGAARVPQ